MENKNRVCPVERAGGLDSSFRKLLHNPRKILEPYIKPGMTVLDLGCGPGLFTVEIAKMLNGSGKVIAADLQAGMLEIVSQKIKGTDLEKLVVIHKCEADKVGVTEQVDLVLAFYMMHEVPERIRILKELKAILKPGGKIYIVEPKFHVSAGEFEEMIKKIQELGFEIINRPKVFWSRSVLLTIK